MRLPANLSSRLVRLWISVATSSVLIVVPCQSRAYAPRDYFYCAAIPGYFDTPEEACEILNAYAPAHGKWTYVPQDRHCISEDQRIWLVRSTLRCAPDASEPAHGPYEKELCGGPFFWSHTTPVSVIEDESCPVGNPVSVGAGVKVLVERDIPGTTHVPALERSYRSQVRFAADDSFGPNWTHQWNRQIQLPTATSETIAVLREDGSSRTFRKVGNTWVSTSGGDTLTRISMAGNNNAWRYFHAADDSIETYDARGRLVQITERNGKTTTLTYSDRTTSPDIAGKSGMLLQVTNHFNQTYRFAYDAAGRIASIIDPTNRTTRYAYNTWGMLSEVEHPDTTRRQYHYEDAPYGSVYAKYVTGISDEAGVRFATYKYDGRGRAISTELAGGVNKHEFAYLDEHTTARINPGGPATLYRQERTGNRLRPTAITGPVPDGGGTKSTQYDAAGNIASTVDFGDNETRYAYDRKGRETQRIENTGRPSQQTTMTDWHPIWNLPTRIAKPNRVDIIEYDGKGQPALHSWYTTSDANGARGFGADRIGPVSSVAWTYDANGLLTSLSEHEGSRMVDQWRFAFDAQGNLATARDSRGRESRALEYDGAGRLVEAIDLDGVRIKYVYDARARPVAYHHGANVTTYAYDAIGQRIREIGPHGRVTDYRYDAAHRLVEVLEDGKSLLDKNADAGIGADTPDSLDLAPENVGANPFERWFGWVFRLFSWLFGPAHAQVMPAPPSHTLGSAVSMPGTWGPTPWDNMASGTGSRRPWEWMAIWTQRAIDACTGKKREEHRGRIQAQGPGYRDPGIGDVEVWGPQPEPPTVSNGLGMLYALESRMSRRQHKDRSGALQKAKRYILATSEAGGARPPGKSFRNDDVIKRGGGERVDIEIRKGIAFVP